MKWRTQHIPQVYADGCEVAVSGKLLGAGADCRRRREGLLRLGAVTG